MNKYSVAAKNLEDYTFLLSKRSNQYPQLVPFTVF